MTIIQSIALGILQGIAEFLPISSSGHLAILQSVFNLDGIPLLFDIILHMATLAAVIIFFRKRIASLFLVLWRFIIRKPQADDVAGQKTIVALLIGTAITGALGIILSKIVPDVPIKVIGAGFIITALLLIFSSYHQSKKSTTPVSNDSFNTKNTKSAGISAIQGVFVGLAQAIGVMPGISRSGITMSASLLVGIDRKAAGEFSFLLSIPAILGAFILELKNMGDVLSAVSPLPLIIGCITAFLAGLVALKVCITLIEKGSLAVFAWYLIPLGIITLVFL